MRNFKAALATPMTDGVRSPAIQIPKTFTYQSYFDSTLLQKAILEQSPNQLIVESTKIESQVPGYAVGLHPSSQTPVAVQFLGAHGQGSAGPYILTPGSVIRPLDRNTPFSGIRWGLPFGWLGGGLATAVIFTSPDAEVCWPSNTEVIFHRARYEILQPAAATADAPKNWPFRFPWTQAVRGSNSFPQSGQPVVSIAYPTRAIIALVGVTGLAAPAAMRAVYQGSNDLSLSSSGAVVLTPVYFKDIVWQSWTSIGAANLADQRPMMQFDDEFIRLAADDGGVAFIDNSGAALLNGAYVDVVRYGVL